MIGWSESIKLKHTEIMIINNLDSPKIISQKDYFGKNIVPMTCPISTIEVYGEKVIKGHRVTLVKKGSKIGVDVFYKNGKLKDFLDCHTSKEAIELYNNRLIFK